MTRPLPKIIDLFINHKKFRNWIIISLLTVISAIVRYSAVPDAPLIWHAYTFVIFATSLFLVWEIFRRIDRWLNKKHPYSESVGKRITIQLSIGIFIMTFFHYVIMELLEQRIPSHFPKELVNMFYTRAFRHILFLLDIIISLAVNANFIAYYFFDEWKKSVTQLERTEKEFTQIQFDNLKNQVNPHFLFNSLSSLNSLIFENQQLASGFLQQLSKVYRYVLQNKQQTVSIKTEVEFIQHYIGLLKTRFLNMLQISIHISEDADDRKIVPVTLQVLIENAIKHNIISELNPLQIRIYDEGDYLVIENNLQTKNIVEGSNKTGLDNMKKLYAFLSDQEVLVESKENKFSVKIPLL